MRNDSDAAADPDSDSESQSDSEHETEPRFLNDVLGEQDPEEAAEIADADEEIRVSFDGTGRLVRMGNQLADYQKRGTELDRVCVWDFISRVDRISKSSDRRRLRSKAENEDNLENGLFDDDAIEDDADTDERDSESVMASDAYRRPRIPLLQGHDQHETHVLRVRPLDEALIPVPIGPGIPR
jgi:hypothetical protein